MFSYCETATMSAKKDGLVNMGGFLVTRNKDVFVQANQLGIVHEGFVTYGGMSGRDMEALAVGLQEGCDEQYLLVHDPVYPGVHGQHVHIGRVGY